MAYTEKSARERYESALKRYRTGTKSQIDPSDMRSRYENLMTKYTQAPVPEQTVQSPQATPVQTQPDPEKRSFGEGAKEFGKAVSGSLGAGILNILRTTLAYAEKAASITLGDGDKSLSENIKDIVSGDRFKDDPDRSTIDKVSPFLSLLGPTTVINVARAMYKSATSETDVNNLIKPTEDKVREWADVENEILPVRIIAGAAGSAPQMLVTMLNPAVGVPILFNSAFQNNLEQYKAEGLDVSDGVVITRAVGSAAIESASEYMFNAWAGLKGASAGLKGAKGVKGAFVSGTKGFLDNFAREAAEKAYAPTVKNFIKFLAKQGLEEGTEELVSGIGAGLMALATTDRGGKFMSWDKEGKTNLKGEAISDEGAIVVMDLIEQFGAGFLMGAVGSTVNTARSFKSTRDVIQNVLGDVNMSSVTEEDVKTVYETLKQDLKSSEAQQELAEKLARGVSKAESVYAEGMQLKNNQTGEVMTVSIAPEGDEITLTSPSGVQKVTHEEFDAMFEQNILTEASPAQTAVNGSDLLPGTPVSGGAVTQQESMTVEGKSRKESVTSYADKKGRPASIKSYMAGKEAVVEIANPGSQVPAYIRFDPDEYSQAENKAMYLQEVSSRNKTPMSKIASKNAQTVSEFYSAITSATDDAVSTYLSEAQNASLKAEKEKKAVESKKTKEEQDKAQAVASVAFAKEEQTIQKETKGKRSDDFSQEMVEKIDKLRKIARDVQKKDVKSGKMDKGVYDALVEIDKSMKEQDIDGYLNVIPDSQVTKRMKKIRDFVKKTTGKKIIFVNSVGDSRVNGVVNDFAKDTVFVNVTGRNDVNITWAIGHELHHLITKDGNGDIMTDAVKDLVGEKAIEDYIAQFKDMPGYQDFLRESGKVTEELVADRAGDVFADPVFWRRIADTMPKSKWKKTANEIAEYLEKAQENAETEKPGVDAMVKAFETTKKAEKRTKKTDTAESNTASKIEMADEMLNMWKEEGEIPADLQDEAERMSLEVATAASEILDVLDNSTTDFSFRSGIRGAMKGEDQRGSVESGIRTIFAPLLGTKKKWSNVDFVGKTVTSGRELAGVAMVARDPRIEHNHIYYVKNGKLIQHESWTSALPSSASALPLNVRHLKNKTEEQISDVMIHQQEAEISRIKSRAAKLGADSIYMSHNHPSGNPQPSPADAGTCGSLMSKFGEMFKGMVVTDHNEYTFLSRDPSQDPSNPKSLQVGRGKLSKGEQGFSARDKASTKKLIDIRGSFSPEGIVRNLFAGISNFTIKDGDITLVFIDSAARITAVQHVPAGMGKKANAEQFAGYIKNSQAYFGGAMVFAVTFNRPGSTNATFAELTSGVFDYGVLEDVLLYDTGARALKSQREYSNTKPDRSADKMRDLSSTILRDSEKIPNRYHTDFSLKVDTSKINDEAYSKLIVTKAKKVFGTTTDLREAGYILPDGTMLDFSGKRDGGESGVRYMDHRDVSEIYPKLQGTEAMQQFFADTGAVRISYSKDMVFADITRAKPLTDKQVSALKSILPRHDSVVVDFYDNFTSESPTKSFEYDMPLVSDISKMLDEIQGTKGGDTADDADFISTDPTRFSIRPPYKIGSKQDVEFEASLNKNAKKTYALFKELFTNSFIGENSIATPFMYVDKWNTNVKGEWGDTARKLASIIPSNIKKEMGLNDDGTITPTDLESAFKMGRSFMQRVVDALPIEIVSPILNIDGKEIILTDMDFAQSIGGEDYRRAMLSEARKLHKEGKLKNISIGSLSKDTWGTLGFLATNTKTGASGDFTTICPQMFFNKGCFYCYRADALRTGLNNKLTAEKVWYTGEILRLSDSSIKKLNRFGGLRIQSFVDWMPHFTPMLADVLYDAETRGLQVKIITKEQSMIETIAKLKESGLGKNLYFNISCDYVIEKAGKLGESKDFEPMNSKRPFMRDDEAMWWKRALSTQEGAKLRAKYPWVNVRIVATTQEEFIRGLKDPNVDVVTGYHGHIRNFERISSETGEKLVEVEDLGSSGMPWFNQYPDGHWEIDPNHPGKTKVQKALGLRIKAEGLESVYYKKSCCITGRCDSCVGFCGLEHRKDSFQIKNATNRDKESRAYWQENLEDPTQFSLRTEDIERQFKDSKVRNEDGTLKLVYHGTPSEFTVFEGSDRNAKGNASKLGFFFTDNKNVADTYRGSFYFESPDIIREYVDGLSDDDLVRFAKSVKDDWGNVIYEEDADEGYEDTKRRFEFLFTDYEGTGFEHIIDGGKDLNLPGWEKLQDIYDEGSGNMIEAYLNITNPYVIEGLDSFDDSAYTEGIQHALDNGHDGVIITDVDDAYTETPYGMNVTGNVYVVFNSEQVKSPDGTNPVDLQNPDIRYSMRNRVDSLAYDRKQAEEIYTLLSPYEGEYTSDVTGDATRGDEIVFAEAEFTGSFKKPKFKGFNLIKGKIVNDSYGADKQQHTFTIETDSGKIMRKGRNVYKYGTFAKPRDASERIGSLTEKHERGNEARRARDIRRSSTQFSIRTDPPPKKTIKAYKAFNVDARYPGMLFPRYVDGKNGMKMGEWYDGDAGIYKITDKGKKVAPATTGEYYTFDDGTKGSAVAYRPGMHSGTIPFAPQMEVGKKQKDELGIWRREYLAENIVFAEIEVSADKDFTTKEWSNPKKGEKKLYYKDMQRLPDEGTTAGFYEFSTNPINNASPAMQKAMQWYISKSIKIVRILEDSEVAAILRKNGITPSPRKSGAIDLKKFGFDSSTQFSMNNLNEFGGTVFNHPAFTSPPAYSIRGKDPETGIDGMIEAHRFNRAFTEQYLSKDTLELLTDAHKFYRVQPNTETIQLAAKKLETKEGRESARIEASNPNNISAVNTVLRMFFMYEADLRGESAVAADWAHVINKSGKQSGQAIQAYAIFNKLTPGAKIMYAEREILGTVSEDNLKRIRDMGKEVKKVTEEIEGKAKDQISIDDILKSVKQAETDVDRKLKALKRLEDRIKKMMSSTMDYDIDAVKEFIDMIHGVTSVMKPTEEIVNTSNPLTFMRWVLNNMDTMGEIMNQAYDMMKRTHGTDEVFMGEVEAYFSEFIPRFKGKKRPSIQGEITEEIKGIINENYHTFQAMVKRLIEIGVNPADAVLIARETRNQINLLTEQEKIRSLKKLLPKPNSKTTQLIIMKIINTMNDNELSDPHVQAYLAQTMGLPNMSPELQTYIYDLGRQISEINRLAAMDGRPLSKDEQRQTDILMAQILSAVQRAKPVHWTKKVDLFQSMMMMSMFKSAERNIIGNTGFLLVDTGKDIVASGIDKVLSKITGNRTIPLPQLGAMVHGAIEGGKVSYYDIMHDIDTSQLDTQYGLGGQEVFKSKLGRLAMKAFRLKMTFPDRIAQGAVYQSALEGIMKMKGETKASQETIEAAQYEAQYKTFSDDNAASSALSGLRDLLNNFYRSQYWKSGRQDKVQFGLGSFMIKFPKVPGALLMRTIDYSPVALVKSLYLLAKPMYDMRKFGGEFTEHFNQKKFAKSLASGTYGTAVSIGVGYLLTMLGLMTGALPDDEKEKNMLATMGVSRGYQLNMSGLWRFLISGFDIEEAQMREGDTLTTYSWMAPMAIGMAIGANVVQDTIKIKETDAGAAEKALEVSIGAFSAGLDSITEMTVMSGLRDFIDNFKYSPTTLEALIKSTVDVPASFIPQQAKIMRELIDNTARTTYSNDNLEYAYRLILNRLPGASKTLPPSRTVFGNLREVYQGNGNNVWNVFFNPAYVTKYTPNEAAVMVLNVMAEKEGTALEGTNVTPGKMTRYLTYTDSLGMKKKINLTDYEISELQRKVGSRVEELFLKIPASTPMPGKIRMMNKILSEVSHAYKQQLLAQKLANRN